MAFGDRQWRAQIVGDQVNEYLHLFKQTLAFFLGLFALGDVAPENRQAVHGRICMVFVPSIQHRIKGFVMDRNTGRHRLLEKVVGVQLDGMGKDLPDDTVCKLISGLSQ